eukprot:TRINITY_DN45595_c0_g1_i1.p1 TRINITY_DN45595_c0_g1~~TRINITY_DN45595_c0_g1_i1.p1  ORF type:complete len:358 (-),score=66.67 TRINITY_DN45595_c0_g1_i1:28-987(-)
MVRRRSPRRGLEASPETTGAADVGSSGAASRRCASLEPETMAEAAEEAEAAPAEKVRSEWTKDNSWGRSFARYIGRGYLPPLLSERLQGRELIEQLFILRQEMKLRIRYELGRLTVRRPSMNRGMNKPVTYASNIWNRGYANCAGHSIVFVSALRQLGVPYCVVAVKSSRKDQPKHAIVEVGFPEATDTREVNRRAQELWADYYGSFTAIKKDPESGESFRMRLFTGLKFTYSPPGSRAAARKGVGRWLWLDPQAKVGHYTHLVDRGYLVQNSKGFSFALTPEIKAWHAFSEEQGASDAPEDKAESRSNASSGGVDDSP